MARAAETLPSYEERHGSGMGSDLRILLVSKTGGGKSSLGNALLREEVFQVNDALSSTQQGCKKVARTIDGRLVTVVDTPGTMDTEHKAAALHEIANAIACCPDGFHVILLVIRVDCRFTEEEKQAVKLVTRMFGKDFYNYAVVVFSHGDDIDNDEGRFYKNLHEARTNVVFMNSLLNDCSNRVALVDNGGRRRPEVQEKQLNTLRGLVDKLVLKNNGAVFSNEYFQLAREELKKEQMAMTESERRRRAEFELRVRKAGEAERARLEAELKEEISQWESGIESRMTETIVEKAKENGESCFPGNAVALTPEGPVRMSELRVGQPVLCLAGGGRLAYSPVYMWGHRDPRGSPPAWVTLLTEGGTRLTLSPDHLLPLATDATTAKATTVPARSLRPGRSAVWTLDASGGGGGGGGLGRLRRDRVTGVVCVTPTTTVGKSGDGGGGGGGLFAPFTLCGNIVVDGVLASCYVDCLPAAASHALLWPVRAAWRVWPGAVEAVSRPEDDGGDGDDGDSSGGMPGWVRLATRGLLPWLAPLAAE